MLLWEKLRLTVGSSESRLEAIRTLAASGDAGAVDILLEALHDRDGQVPVKAAEALGKIGSPRAVPTLIAAFKDKDDYIRWAAADALARIGKPAVAALITALRDPIPTARDQAIRTLGQIGAVAIPPLLEALRNPHKFMREAAAEALGGIEDERSVAALVKALDDREVCVREKAAHALVQIGKPAVPALLGALNHAKADVRQRAHDALEKLGREPMTENYDRPIAHGKWKDVAQVTTAALEPIMAALDDPSKERRFTAVRTLANVGDERAVAGLMRALGDDDREVRNTAVQALVKVGPVAVEPLLSVLEEGPAAMRPNVVAVLGLIRDARSRAPLVAALKDADPAVRSTAAEALAIFKDPLMEGPLVAALQDPDPAVRFNAIGTLWRISTSETVIDRLIERLDDEDDATRKRAVQALGNIAGEEAVAPLLALLRRETGCRLEIALAVAKILPAAGVRPLVTVAVDSAADAEEAVEILTEVLQAAAADIAPSDLEAVAELPGKLDGQRAAAANSVLVKKAVNAGRVAELAVRELIRRGLMTREAANAVVRGASDSRIFPRRPAKAVDVLILTGMHQVQPDLGQVVDRSDGGVGLMTRKRFEAGTMLTLRPASAHEDLPWVLVEVRHVRAAGKSCRLGCKFVRSPSPSVVSMLG